MNVAELLSLLPHVANMSSVQNVTTVITGLRGFTSALDENCLCIRQLL